MTFHRVRAAFAERGLAGLVPARRGPRGPRKITPEIRRFAADYRRRHGRVGATRLARAIEAEFGLRLHPRSLERALPRTAKKKRSGGTPVSARALHVYEDWRARFAAGRPCPGLAALQRRGLLEALRAAGPGPTAAQTPARAVAPAAAPGPRRAALVGAVAALLRSLPAADGPRPPKENRS